MKKNVFNILLAFLADLERGKIHYTLTHQRDNAIMVIVTVPGEHWEIEFCDDGSVEVERFISNGEIEDEAALSELLSKFSDYERDDIGSFQEPGLAVIAEHNVMEKVYEG